MLVQAAASAVDAAVEEDVRLAGCAQRGEHDVRGGPVVSVEGFVLAAAAVLDQEQQVRAGGTELVEGEEVGGGDGGDFEARGVDVAAGLVAG